MTGRAGAELELILFVVVGGGRELDQQLRVRIARTLSEAVSRVTSRTRSSGVGPA